MKKRNNNGMGSVRQRKDGRWEARYSTPDGRQRSVYGKTEAEATKKLRQALHDLDKGSWREPSRMTVGEWLDIWIKDYQGHTTGRTVESYTMVINNHFKPNFGTVKLSAFSQIHVRRMVATMQRNGRSASTIKHARATLSSAMRCAVEAGLIAENPVSGIKIPKAVKAPFTVVDREQIPAFIEAAMMTVYPYELLIMLYTGLRIGEVRGLKWEDVDLVKGTMHVQRQLDAKGQFIPPKDGEQREMHLPAEAVEALKAQRKRQAEQRLAAASWDESGEGLVFRQPSGKPHNQNSIYPVVVAVGKTMGLNLHPHDLRHSYAVAALRSGVDVKTVQHNLGHKSASITLDTYAAYTSDAGKVGAQLLSRYFREAKK